MKIQKESNEAVAETEPEKRPSREEVAAAVDAVEAGEKVIAGLVQEKTDAGLSRNQAVSVVRDQVRYDERIAKGDHPRVQRNKEAAKKKK